ncbi:hypothetical protein [Fibrobacter sp.]|jgi:hypothetical protein
MLSKFVNFLMKAQYAVYVGIIVVIVRRIVMKIRTDMDRTH